jgi:hypothetical protein
MKTSIFSLCFLLPSCLMACSKGDTVEAAPAVCAVVVHMAADNDLWADALAGVEKKQAGFSERGLLVENEEQLTPAAQDEASKPPNTQATRQGEASEVQPRGSALPP